MNVAVRRYSSDPIIFNTLKDRLEDDFVPKLKQISGFIAYYAIKTGPDTLCTVSVFETEAGERESTQLSGEFVAHNYAAIKTERLSVDEGVCIVQHRAPAAV
ncbi:MAG: hypothetical protein JO322_16645 [Candidatus Eremiobacteraeota bacterium]|nr:hypothetical protein [Candidatus Eremiobacteraeota bacterium]